LAARSLSDGQPQGAGTCGCLLWLAVRPGRSLDRETLNPLNMVNPIEEQKRQDRLDSWYEKDGRDDKSHSLHSLYTGLASKYMNQEQANA
jgi:hypothetical protein